MSINSQPTRAYLSAWLTMVRWNNYHTFCKFYLLRAFFPTYLFLYLMVKFHNDTVQDMICVFYSWMRVHMALLHKSFEKWHVGNLCFPVISSNHCLHCSSCKSAQQLTVHRNLWFRNKLILAINVIKKTLKVGGPFKYYFR